MQLCFISTPEKTNLEPLTLTRPIDNLRVGILTISEKWQKYLNNVSVHRTLDQYYNGVFSTPDLNSKSPCLLINPSFIPNKDVVNEIQALSLGEGLFKSNTFIAGLIDGESALAIQKKPGTPPNFKSKKNIRNSIDQVRFLWDLLSLNVQEIEKDILLFSYKNLNTELYQSKIFVSSPERIFVSPTAKIEAGSNLIADNGPIFIGDNAIIESGSIIKGPVAICHDSVTKMGCRIYDGTTVGPVCKIGGEVSHTIFHSYSNKAHDGFVGNSIFGQWCNMGADSNTSNLNNNYSTVKLADWNSGELIETGYQFLGSILGDHSKTAINTMLNTGTVCGVSTNIFMSSFPPKRIPSFTWLGDTGPKEYRLDKALEAMQAMMKRRGIELDKNYKTMMTELFNNKS